MNSSEEREPQIGSDQYQYQEDQIKHEINNNQNKNNDEIQRSGIIRESDHVELYGGVDDNFNSNLEIPANELSGDEHDEKECANSIAISQFKVDGQKKKQNIFFGGVTVMKTIVGSGILGLPNVMGNFGIIFGTLLFTGILFLNQYTVGLLIKSKNLCGRSNFCTIGLSAVHINMKYVVNLIVITNNIGVCMVEMVIFGNTAQNLLGMIDKNLVTHWYAQFRFLTFLSSLLISPLIFVKSIDKLKHVALFAIVSIFLFSICTVVTFFDEYKLDGNQHFVDNVYWFIPSDFNFPKAMGQFPVLLLAFGFHFNLFPIYKSLDAPSDKKGKAVSFGGLFSSYVLYMVVAIMGYLAYGKNVKVDFIDTIDENHVGTFLYAVLNLSFVISTTFSFPIMFFGARNNLFSLISDLRARQRKDHFRSLQKSAIEYSKADKSQNRQSLLVSKNRNIKEETGITGIFFYILTSIVYALVVGTAIIVGNIEPIFNVIGSIDSTAICYVLPCLFYIKLTRKNNFSNIHYLASWVIMIFSSIVAVTCLTCNYLYTDDTGKQE
ncbi:hypothetical protein PPERSA_12823 [Pseudocohnilembus persalinus]|uniref:Amino acid transporter transmembrane domain-containing protein n=1 Tax=Pseudocohnilembus persalinus TaxID=266149 RepID=A0A0V0QEG9_PSEPJ|nr:hypothetical protein PPERSA_12823 [Pseudocohnilembus persalinus]|eukprot:KRX00604.1 hypothetical protein PPERSA_12823 [Pseudocohnilembus persalinus]